MPINPQDIAAILSNNTVKTWRKELAKEIAEALGPSISVKATEGSRRGRPLGSKNKTTEKIAKNTEDIRKTIKDQSKEFAKNIEKTVFVTKPSNELSRLINTAENSVRRSFEKNATSIETVFLFFLNSFKSGVKNPFLIANRKIVSDVVEPLSEVLAGYQFNTSEDVGKITALVTTLDSVRGVFANVEENISEVEDAFAQLEDISREFGFSEKQLSRILGITTKQYKQLTQRIKEEQDLTEKEIELLKQIGMPFNNLGIATVLLAGQIDKANKTIGAALEDLAKTAKEAVSSTFASIATAGVAATRGLNEMRSALRYAAPSIVDTITGSLTAGISADVFNEQTAVIRQATLAARDQVNVASELTDAQYRLISVTGSTEDAFRAAINATDLLVDAGMRIGSPTFRAATNKFVENQIRLAKIAGLTSDQFQSLTRTLYEDQAFRDSLARLDVKERAQRFRLIQQEQEFAVVLGITAENALKAQRALAELGNRGPVERFKAAAKAAAVMSAAGLDTANAFELLSKRDEELTEEERKRRIEMLRSLRSRILELQGGNVQEQALAEALMNQLPDNVREAMVSLQSELTEGRKISEEGQKTAEQLLQDIVSEIGPANDYLAKIVQGVDMVANAINSFSGSALGSLATLAAKIYTSKQQAAILKELIAIRTAVTRRGGFIGGPGGSGKDGGKKGKGVEKEKAEKKPVARSKSGRKGGFTDKIAQYGSKLLGMTPAGRALRMFLPVAGFASLGAISDIGITGEQKPNEAPGLGDLLENVLTGASFGSVGGPLGATIGGLVGLFKTGYDYFTSGSEQKQPGMIKEQASSEVVTPLQPDILKEQVEEQKRQTEELKTRLAQLVQLNTQTLKVLNQQYELDLTALEKQDKLLKNVSKNGAFVSEPGR